MDADIYVFDSQGENALAQLLLELCRPDGDFARVPNLSGLGIRFSRSERGSESNDLDANIVDYIFGDDYISPFVWMRTAQLHLRLRLLPLSCSGRKSYSTISRSYGSNSACSNPVGSSSSTAGATTP
jgi:hypothetical protein